MEKDGSESEGRVLLKYSLLIEVMIFSLIFSFYWDVMWCDVMWCDVMWCDVMWCDVMWCDVMWWWCDVMWCDVMWCDVMWCDVMWCDVMWGEMRWDEMRWYGVRSRGNPDILILSPIPLSQSYLFLIFTSITPSNFITQTTSWETTCKRILIHLSLARLIWITWHRYHLPLLSSLSPPSSFLHRSCLVQN